MKYIITESQHNKAIDKFITHQFEPHEEKTSENYPNSIFWVKDGEVVAEISEKWNNFIVYYKIWDTISDMFSLEEVDTKRVINNWLEKHYKLEGLPPGGLSKGRVVSLKNIIN